MNNRHLIIFIRGLPGTGKTTLALKMQESNPEKYIVLDPDLIDSLSDEYRRFEGGIPAEVSREFIPYRYLLNEAIDSLKMDRQVIWVQAWTKIGGMEKAVRSLKNNIEELGVIIVELKTTREIITSRLRERELAGGNVLSRRSLSEFESNFEFAVDPPFDATIIHLDATKPVNLLVTELFQKLT